MIDLRPVLKCVDGLFSINHYAGEVVHNTNGFCYKNKDTMREEILELFKHSSSSILSKIYKRGLKIKAKGYVSKVFVKVYLLVKVISKPIHIISVLNRPNGTESTRDYW